MPPTGKLSHPVGRLEFSSANRDLLIFRDVNLEPRPNVLHPSERGKTMKTHVGLVSKFEIHEKLSMLERAQGMSRLFPAVACKASMRF